MISLFDSELTAMEQEVRDLKTIYQRGLGTTRFYSDTAQKNVAYSMGIASFSISVVDDAVTPIAIVPAIQLPTPVSYSTVVFSIGSDGDNASVTTISFSTGTVKLKVMCSSEIQEIS